MPSTSSSADGPTPVDAGAARPSKTFKRLQAELRGLVGRAIGDYAMIRDGDLVMVCLSGGKDSYTLLDLLLSLQRSAPIRFEIVAVNLDQKQPGFPAEVLPAYLAALGVRYEIVSQDTYSVVKRLIPEGKTMCSLCSRLRRGALYHHASRLGASKIALGHHRDDILETLLLNLFHGGRLKAMPPKLLSDDGRHIVIRPLAYVPERLIRRYARARQFPIIPCNLCGSQPRLERVEIGRLLEQWERDHPGRIESMFSALTQVAPSQLADPALFDFAGLDGRRGQSTALLAESEALAELEPRAAAFGFAAPARAGAATNGDGPADDESLDADTAPVPAAASEGPDHGHRLA